MLTGVHMILEPIIKKGADNILNKVDTIILSNIVSIINNKDVKSIIELRKYKTQIANLTSYIELLNKGITSKPDLNKPDLNKTPVLEHAKLLTDQAIVAYQNNSNVENAIRELYKYLDDEKIVLSKFKIKKIEKLVNLTKTEFQSFVNKSNIENIENLSNVDINNNIIQEILLCLFDNIIKKIEIMMDNHVYKLFLKKEVQNDITNAILNLNHIRKGGVTSIHVGGGKFKPIYQNGGNINIDIPQSNIIELFNSLNTFLTKQNTQTDAFDILSGSHANINKLINTFKLPDYTQDLLIKKIAFKLKNAIIKRAETLISKTKIDNQIINDINNHNIQTTPITQTPITKTPITETPITKTPENNGGGIIPGLNDIKPILLCFIDNILEVISEKLEPEIIKIIKSSEVQNKISEIISGASPIKSGFMGIFGWGGKKSHRKYKQLSKQSYRKHFRKTIKYT